MNAFADWSNFYTIIGSSAGALIGLQFVVISLVADKRIDSDEQTTSALLSPPVVHFSCALLLSAVIVVPWPRNDLAALVCALIGIGGIIYQVAVLRHIRSQTKYTLVAEDWIFRVVLPFLAYTILAPAAVALAVDARDALFGIGIVTLALLFIGIHDAWDNVVYLAIIKRHAHADAASLQAEAEKRC